MANMSLIDGSNLYRWRNEHRASGREIGLGGDSIAYRDSLRVLLYCHRFSFSLTWCPIPHTLLMFTCDALLTILIRSNQVTGLVSTLIDTLPDSFPLDWQSV